MLENGNGNVCNPLREIRVVLLTLNFNQL